MRKTPRARYAVGYGRPPTSSQFQPGQSRNPEGRPKGVRDASSMARDALERTVNVKLYGTWRTMTVRKAAYLRLAERAVAIRAAKTPSGPVHVNSWDNSERLNSPQVDHETDVEKWLIDRHRSEKSIPQATLVGTFT